jgi:hypothetical protein
MQLRRNLLRRIKRQRELRSEVNNVRLSARLSELVQGSSGSVQALYQLGRWECPNFCV